VIPLGEPMAVVVTPCSRLLTATSPFCALGVDDREKAARYHKIRV
jgi:hypothetical protein